MPRRIEDFRGLTQASRLKLLHAVQRKPGRRLHELAEEAGIHVNTAREHLHVLEDEGFIVSRTLSTGSRGRPPVVFEPVRRAAENPHADRRAAHAQEQGDLLRRIDPSLDRSAALGVEGQHQLDALYSHLDDAGLEPELDDESLDITMQPCNYPELIDENGAVVCAVHAKLVRDQLRQVPGPLRMRALVPFVTDHACRLLLERRAGEGTGESTGESDGAGPGGDGSAATGPDEPASAYRPTARRRDGREAA